ncbi:MAG: universal stress protein [Desulfobacterales bacterium]|jgi:nucleotide-binding universal stress UspA family protein|nr:universal stress protein [Desulfobacterales bacterium]
MVIQKILLPYNYTPLDHKAVDFTVEAFSHLKSVEITIFKVYAPLPKIEATDAAGTGKLRESLNYLTNRLAQRESELNSVKQKLAAKGFDEARIKTIYRPRQKDVASEILDLNMVNKFDVIILNRRPARIARFFSGSISNKIIMSVQGTTVCVVS